VLAEGGDVEEKVDSVVGLSPRYAMHTEFLLCIRSAQGEIIVGDGSGDKGFISVGRSVACQLIRLCKTQEWQL
jgi:hypothetical protein